MKERSEQLSTKRVLVSLIKSVDAYNSLLKDHQRRANLERHSGL